MLIAPSDGVVVLSVEEYTADLLHDLVIEGSGSVVWVFVVLARMHSVVCCIYQSSSKGFCVGTEYVT